MRPWLACSSLVLAAATAAGAATARPAAADSALMGGKVQLKLFIPKNNGDDGLSTSQREDDYQQITDPTTSLDLKRYLNEARCECDRMSPGNLTGDTSSLLLLKLSYETQPSSDPGDVGLTTLAGTQCDAADQTQVDQRCSQFGAAISANDLDDNNEDVFGQVGDVLAPGNSDGAPNPCNPESKSTDVVVVSGTTTKFVESEKLTVPYDLKAPELPDSMTATGLDGEIHVSWDQPATNPDYYQALCTKADGSPAHSLTDGATANPTSSPRFDTTDSVCGIAPVVPTAATLTDGSGASGTLPDVLNALDRDYVCGDGTGGSPSVDLKGLENGQSYWVVVLAVDTSGNYTAHYLPHVISPVASTDFWEDANDEKPEISGGFCISQVGRGGSGGSALVVLGAAVFALRRRRRRRAGGAGSATMLGLTALFGLGGLAFAPRAAHAQSWDDPYWTDPDAESTDRVETPQWHLGVRMGPYHPSVDKSFDSSPGPFRRMFGPGYQLVPQLDLHRLWAVGGLQLGVGLSGGYYAKSADAYQIGTSPSDPDRPRQDGSTNTFKMIPLAVTGVARLTELDDRWGIPFVPYLRGGLAYDIWWVRTATGDLAVTDCETCDDKALGASAGLVGAVGVELRAERLDPDARRSMQGGGVEHAGFYAELETGWVNSFGSSRRLSLGDTTWYAGVDFEF
ncbi:MAG TPA: MXAN_2562 family outer membrane beta-barrel protein [Kofleriaceae bacterium]|nr:MXAN_2562 family outer membrane beta-barrel protein [Kofleriaceae bacterium]